MVGSPADVATLLVVLSGYARLRSRVEGAFAGLVALARGDDSVDDDRLQDELDVDDVQVRAVTDGGPRGDGGGARE